MSEQNFTSASIDPQPAPTRLVGPLCFAAALWVFYLVSEIVLLGGRLGLSLDDGWIHLQFARNLATGDGLAFQSDGPWATASTAPLWTALLSPLFLLPGNVIFWTKVLGGALLLATVHAAGRLAAEIGLPAGAQKLAAIATAASHWLVWSSLSGMEILLFSFLSLWACTLHLRGSEASWAFFSFAVLARPEGALLLALAFADRFLRRDLRSATRGIVYAAIALTPTLLFYQYVGGSPLPSTFFVKTSAQSDLLPSGRYLRTVIDVLFRSQPLLFLLAGAGVLRLVEQHRRGLLLACWVLGLPFVQSMTASDSGPAVVGNFGRYYFPLIPFVVVLGVYGAERSVRDLRAPLRWALVALLLLPQFWGVARGGAVHARTVANVEQSDVAAALWLAERLPPDVVVATQDIGAVKFFLPNPIVDLAGLVNPEILPVLRGVGDEDPRRWEERLYGFLEERRPAVLVVFPEHYPNLVRQSGFRVLARFPIEENRTMAGDELVVFATPWE